MGLLVRKENQEKRDQLDLQGWLLHKVLREKKGIKGSVEYLAREGRKVSEGNLGLLASQERWEFLELMVSTVPQALWVFEGIKDHLDHKESQG